MTTIVALRLRCSGVSPGFCLFALVLFLLRFQSSTVCVVKPGIDPSPHQLGHGTKDIRFQEVLLLKKVLILRKNVKLLLEQLQF